MHQKILVNPITKSETGLDYVQSKLSLGTPFGKEEMKNSGPYYPGDETALSEELKKVGILREFYEKNSHNVSKLHDIFSCLKDLSGSINRASSQVLSTVELYEIKSYLLYLEKMDSILTESLAKDADTEEFFPGTCDELLNILDPKGDRIDNFYIYDDFSDVLARLRSEKKKLDVEIRKSQKAAATKLKEETGIILTPKFDVIISKSEERYKAAEDSHYLEKKEEDYSSATFILKTPEDVYDRLKDRDRIEMEIDEKEYKVRGDLSRKVGDKKDELISSFKSIGRLDFVLAKGILSSKYDMVIPEISDDFRVSYKDARHIELEDLLKAKGRDFTPISVELMTGVTCITGANMGGKTISLKLAGLIPLMAQFGYHVPCREAHIGLSNYIRILVGDNQSIERGLSSFGSEMEELKNILDRAEERSLILIDEIASGTNPLEGMALTKAIAEYLKDKPYISLITTHFDLADKGDIKNFQVRGLEGVDFKKLNSKLTQADRRGRIEIIGEYMDYSLMEVEPGKTVPKDAINIARMLGLPDEIINKALNHVAEEK